MFYDIVVLLYFALNTMFELNAFGENVAKGFATETIFDAPLTKSKTPTEFWTKRWNHMIHLLLKVCCTELSLDAFDKIFRWPVYRISP